MVSRVSQGELRDPEWLARSRAISAASDDGSTVAGSSSTTVGMRPLWLRASAFSVRRHVLFGRCCTSWAFVESESGYQAHLIRGDPAGLRVAA